MESLGRPADARDMNPPPAPTGASVRLERFLSARALPLLCGLVSALLVWWIWGWVDPPPIIDDEAAYLLQAKIFAEGRWTASARPRPEFFDQMQVFTRPRLASKYPPGHSLLLVPGVRIGLPVLVPILTVGISAAMLLLIARRLSNPWIALAAWLIWVTSEGVRVVAPTYLSELDTGALWLFGWWVLLRWRKDRRTKWLSALAAIVAWGILTRPLTAAAYAVAAAAAVLPAIISSRRWRLLTAPVIVGLSILTLVPVWSFQTLGRWGTTPYSWYSSVYFPYEKPGFGESRVTALAPLPLGSAEYDAEYRMVHRAHTLSSLPGTALRRAASVGRLIFDGRPILLVFLLIGAFGLSPEVIFALATCALLLLFYLPMAHPPDWAVYYFETLPVLAFLTALGLWRCVSWLWETAQERKLVAFTETRRTALLLALPAAIAFGSVSPILLQRKARRQATAPRQTLRQFARSPTSPRSIVFIPCSPRRFDLCELVENDPDLARARVWLVHDLGPKNAELASIAPDRLLLSYGEDRVLRRVR
jgi:Dolichyl-phosphate-mannose-protein mannosyltransferase